VEQQNPTPQSELDALQASTAQHATEHEPTIDTGKVEIFIRQLEASQNLPMGIIGGLIAALVGAGIWAGVTVGTGYQIGWMAVGVGCIVGLAVRAMGKGLTTSFGVVGAAFALLGCLAGNLLSVCGAVSMEFSVPFFDVVTGFVKNPSIVIEVMKETFHPMDLLFYGIAVYEGYRFSFRKITEAELQALGA